MIIKLDNAGFGNVELANEFRGQRRKNPFIFMVIDIKWKLTCAVANVETFPKLEVHQWMVHQTMPIPSFRTKLDQDRSTWNLRCT
ncbi:Stress-Responsive Dnajb4-Interacting Membrane Protein 1 [Manis pentadactyla]|nr:Stress-Responsive Dnajb4-Interacting Membrane Protein 1 [Manis pentadactyla]